MRHWLCGQPVSVSYHPHHKRILSSLQSKSTLFLFKTTVPCPVTTGQVKSLHLSQNPYLYIERLQYDLQYDMEPSSELNNLSSLNNLWGYSVFQALFSSYTHHMSLSLWAFWILLERGTYKSLLQLLLCALLSSMISTSELLWVFQMHYCLQFDFVIHIAHLWMRRGNEKLYIDLKKVQHFCVLLSQGQVTHCYLQVT